LVTLSQYLNPMVHLYSAAVESARSWWAIMSDVEKRQAQQRAFSVAACAAVFAVGGPIISHRVELQKTDEAYRADAARLAMSVAEQRAGKREGFATASFDDTATPVVWKASYSFGPADAPESPAVRDSMLASRFGVITSDNLENAEGSKSEFDCLAEAVYYEARSETVRGQLAVAEVVLNRVQDARFPKTICGVVYQGQYRSTGCQFTFTCDGSLRSRPRGPAWERARSIALHVQMGLAKPVTNKATHYHTNYVNPVWSAGLVETKTIGTHIFYRFPKTGAEWSRARASLEAERQHRQAYEAVEVSADALAVQELDSLTTPALLVDLSIDAAEQPKVAASRPL
jgi:hypothetical protein